VNEKIEMRRLLWALDQRIADHTAPGISMLYGTVTAVGSGTPKLTVLIDGSQTPVPMLSLKSYSSPAVNDRVLILHSKGTAVVQGPMQ